MILILTMLLIAIAALAACDSPEATRTRGGGPGADVGNRDKVVEMHEGSRPSWETPHIIESKHAPIGTARQADELSRRSSFPYMGHVRVLCATVHISRGVRLLGRVAADVLAVPRPCRAPSA